MKKGIAWLAVVSIILTSLVSAACGAGEGTTKAQSGAKPQYGGTVSILMLADPTFNLLALGKAAPHLLSHNLLWDGDWAKGPAGGYGTNEVSWTESTNIPNLMSGHLAESITWSVDAGGQTVTTVIKVRRGIHYALDSTNEASSLVNGRELTADDVLYTLTQANTSPDSQNYVWFPAIREIKPVKTGPWEVSVTHPIAMHLDATMRLLNDYVIYPPELQEKYKAAFNDWKNDCGTGPYIITDFVSGSQVSLKRNNNYWMKNPVGPGKGNQLPYAENIKYYIITDASTRESALRSATIDRLGGFTPEDYKDMQTRIPDLKAAQAGTWGISPLYMRTDLEPFSDVRVRRALMMATDFNAINDSLYGGLAQILSWPYWNAKAYEDLYLGLDDPEMPASVKELYTYSPDKAKQLLSDAGYPAGFKAILTLSSDTTTVDYYSIVKGQWSKANIDVSLDLIEPNTVMNVAANKIYKGLFALFYSPPSTYPEQAPYAGTTWINASLITDKYIFDEAQKARVAAITSFPNAMKMTKELMKYLLDQAYCIPTPRYPQYVMWWPWIKNYDGETSVGYFSGDSWVEYVWVDQDLKKSLGH